MNFFESLVDEHLLPEPKGFQYVAARLQGGASALQVRNEIMERTGASRLAAGKLVEETERAVKVAKANRVAGVGVLLLGVFLLLVGDWRAVFALLLGPAQFAAGQRVWTLYKKAGTLEAPAGEKP